MTNSNPQAAAAAALAGLPASSLNLLLVVTRAAVALPAGDERGRFLRACLAALDAADAAGWPEAPAAVLAPLLANYSAQVTQ